MGHYNTILITLKKPNKRLIEKILDPFREIYANYSEDDSKYIENVSCFKKVFEIYENSSSYRNVTFKTYLDGHPFYYNFPIVKNNDIIDINGKHKRGWIKIYNDHVVDIIVRKNPNGIYDYYRKYDDHFFKDKNDKYLKNPIQKKYISVKRTVSSRDVEIDINHVFSIVGNIDDLITYEEIIEKYPMEKYGYKYQDDLFDNQRVIKKIREDNQSRGNFALISTVDWAYLKKHGKIKYIRDFSIARKLWGNHFIWAIDENNPKSIDADNYESFFKKMSCYNDFHVALWNNIPYNAWLTSFDFHI